MSYYNQDEEPTIAASAIATGDTVPLADISVGGTIKTATMQDVRQFATSGLTNCTASSLAVTAALHAGHTITLNRAAGIAVTLPAATGTGCQYRLVVGTTFTGAATIKVVGDDIMKGTAILALDGGDTVAMFATAADSDTITFAADNSTGGVAGAEVLLIDIAADTWFVRLTSDAAATEATPFSATVS